MVCNRQTWMGRNRKREAAGVDARRVEAHHPSQSKQPPPAAAPRWAVETRLPAKQANATYA